MFTKQHYILVAEMLGSHVIPMCLVSPSWQGGTVHWNSEAILKFHRMCRKMVDYFQQDNPNFNLPTFNKKMLDHAREAISKTAPHLNIDSRGFEVAGRKAPPNDSTFVTLPLNAEDFKI